ncbi:MAG: hypothetical protein ACXW05_06390, partial [Gemmatirosa sp.]
MTKKARRARKKVPKALENVILACESRCIGASLDVRIAIARRVARTSCTPRSRLVRAWFAPGSRIEHATIAGRARVDRAPHVAASDHVCAARATPHDDLQDDPHDDPHDAERA